MKLIIQFCLTITLLMFLGISAKAGVTSTLFGLAASPCEGRVRDVESTLYTINTSTGAATAVGTGVGFERCSGMDFDSTGTLFAACERNDGSDLIVLITINTSTGVGSEIGTFCGADGGATDLSVKNSDDVLYGAVFDLPLVETCDFDLATLNKGTGAESSIGTFTNFTTGFDGSGMAFSGIDTLFLGAGQNLHTVNQSTAVLTNICTIDTPSSFDDSPRPNAMDFHPVSDVLFASIVNGSRFGGDNREWFLTNINTTTCDVDVIGQTVNCLDAIAFELEPSELEPPSGPVVIIPTLGQWGMIIATILLGFFAVFAIRRRTES